MANRYWVGGTGTWNSSSTTNWSTSSGGSSGASVPTPSDSVFFDQAGTYTVTMTGILNCLNITTSTGTVTFATGTGPQLFISGSMTLAAGTVWNSTGTITFNATTSQTITTNSTTLTPNITFNGTGGTWTLGSALTTGTNALTTLVAGAIDLSGFTFTTGIFSSSNNNTRSISFGTGNIVMAFTLPGVNNLLMTNATNFTLTGTGGFTAPASVARIFTFGTTGGSITNSPNLSFTGSGTSAQTLTTGSWFNTLNFGTTAFTLPATALNLNSLTLSSGGSVAGLTPTIRNTGTVTGNGNTTLASLTVNHTGTTSLASALTMTATSTFTLTSGALNLNGYDLSTGIFSSTGAVARSISFGTNNIVLTHTTAATTVLSMADVTNFTYTGTGGFTASASVTRTYTFGTTAGSATNSPNLSFTGSASVTQTITTGSYFNILDFGTTGFTLDITTLNLNSLTLSVLGDYSLLTANMVGTGTITPNGKSIGTLTINHSGITTIASVATTYKTFTYAGSGSITFPAVNSPPAVDSLAIAGGGSGGGTGGAGGGAGGMLRGGFSPVAGAQYTITVGAGGTSVGSSLNGNQGQNSSITGTGVSLTAIGGGYGSSYSSVTVPKPGGSGGSGGGAGGASVFPGTLSSAGGSGTVGQGFDGGSTLNSSQTFISSGGGGAGAPGTGLNAPVNGGPSGAGGAGTISAILGTLTYYAGGGGGGQISNQPGAGGIGGGGLGGYSGGTVGTPGTANTGGGGGGGGNNNPVNGSASGAGGSGIVILRYPSTYADPSATTGTPTVTSTTNSFTVLGTTTLTSGALNLNGPLFTSIFNSDNTNTRSISFGTNNITLVSPTASTTVLSMGTATGFTYTGTGGFTADASVARTYRFGSTAGGSSTNSPNLSLTGAPASTQTFTTGSWFNTLNFGTVNSTVATTNLNLNNLTLSSGGTYTGLSATMVGTGTITNNGRNIAGLTINNGAGTTTLTGALGCTTYTQTAGTIDFATFNLTCSSTATYTAGTLSNMSTISCTTWTCAGTFTLTSGTITPSTSFVVTGAFNYNGGTLSAVPTFTHTSGTVTLGKAYALIATGTYTLTAGTLNLNGFDLTTGILSSSNSNTRSITFGTNNIILATTTAAISNLVMGTATNFTYTGTGGFTAAADITRTFDFGGTAGGTATNAPNLTFTGSGTAVQSFPVGLAYFKTLNFGTTAFNPGTTLINVTNLILSSGGTFTGLTIYTLATGTITSNGNTTLFKLYVAGVGVTTSLADTLTLTATGTTQINAGTLNLNGFNLTTGIFASSPVAFDSAVTFGSNNIILAHPTAGTTVLQMSTGNVFTCTGTGGFVTDASVTRTFNTTIIAARAGSVAPNLSITSGSSTLTFTTNSSFNKLDFGTTTSTIGITTLNLNALTLSSTGTYTSLTANMIGTGTITPNTKTIADLIVNTSGTVTLAGALGCANYTQTVGTIDFATFNLTCAGTATYTAGTLSNIGTISCTTWTCAGTFTLTSGTITPSTGFTLTSGAFNYNGGTLSPVPTFTHTSGTVTLGKAYALTATGAYTLTAGTLDLAGFTLTTGTFSSNNSNTRSISFGTGNIVLATTTAAQTNLSMATATGFTYTGTGGFTADASVVRTYTFGTTAGATATNGPNLTFTGSGTAIPVITAGSTFNKLDFGITAFTLAATTVQINSLTLSTAAGVYTNLSVFTIGTGTITPNGKSIGPLGIFLGTGGTTTLAGALACTTYTQSSGTIDFASLNLTCSSTATYTAGTLSNIGTITCTTWTCSSGTFTLTQGTISASTSFVINGGNFNYNGGTITTNTFTQTSGNVTLGAAFTLASTCTYTLTAGTLSLNGFNLSTGFFATAGAAARSIAFSTNTITLTGASGTVLSMAVLGGFTYTGTGGFTTDASVVRTYSVGSTSGGTATNAPNVTFTGSGTAIPVLTTASWFGTLNFGTTAFTLAATTLNLNALILSTSGTYTNLSVTMVGTGTITPNGKAIAGFVINNGAVTGTTTLAAAVSCTTLTLTSGTLDSASFNITPSTTVTFNGNTTLTNTGTITCTTWTVSAGTFTMTNGTITPSTSFVVSGGNFNYNGGTLSAVSTFTHTSGGVSFGKAYSLTATGTYTFTAGALTLNGFDLTTGIFSSSGTSSRTVTFGTNNIILAHTTAGTTVLAMNDISNFFNDVSTGGFVGDASVTRTYTIGVTASAFVIPTGFANLSITGSGTAVQTITTGSRVRSLNFGSTAFTLPTTSITFYSGGLTLSSGGTYTNLTATFNTAAGYTSCIFTPNGKTIGPLVITSGTVTLAGALGCTTYTQTAGGIDFATFNLTCSSSVAYTAGTLSNVGTITCTTWTVTGTFTMTNGTITPSTSFVLTSGAFNYNGGTLSPVPAFTHTAGTVTLGQAYALSTTGTYTLTAGTLNLNGFNLTTGAFSSSGAVARSIIFGTNTITLNHSTAATTVLNMATVTGFTYTGTPSFVSDASITRTFTFGTTGGLTTNAPNLSITSGASVPTFTDGSWFKVLDFTGSSTTPAVTASILGINLDTLTLSSGGTYTNLIPIFTRTQTWTSQFSKQLGGIGFNLAAGTLTLDNTQTYTATSQCLLTIGSLSLTGDQTFGVFNSNNANTRSIQFSTFNIVLATTTAAATNLSMATATGFTYTGTGGFTAAADITRTYTFGTTGGSTTNAPNLTFTGSGTAVQTLTTASWFNTLNFGTTAFNPGTTALNVNSLTLSSSGTYTTLTPTFVGTGTITSNGKTIAALTINTTGTVTLGGVVTYALATATTTLTSGTLDLNGNNLTTGIFSSTGASTRSIIFGSNNIILATTTAATIVLSMSNATGFTYTGTGGFTAAADITRTFTFGTTGGSATNAPNLTLTGSGTAIQTIATGSWFNTLNFGTTAFAIPTTTVNVVNITLSSGGTYTALTINMVGSGTITTNGKPIAALNFTGSGTTTLGSSLTLPTTTVTTLTSGTLNLNGFDLTTGTFSSNNSNVRSILFGVGNIILTTATAAATNLDMATITNFTWTGTGGFRAAADITRTYTVGSTAGSSASAPNLAITSGAAVPTFTDGSWFNQLDFTGTTSTPAVTASVLGINVSTLTLATGGTYTSLIPVFTRTQTWSMQQSKQLGGIGVNGLGVTLTLDNTQTYTATAPFILTQGTLDLGGVNLTIGRFVSNNSNTRSISFGTNNIILATTTASATNLDMATATGFTYTGTGGFTAAADIVRTFTFGTTGGSATNSPNLTFTGTGTAIPVLTTGSYFNKLDFGTTVFVLGVTSLNLNGLTLSASGTFSTLQPTFVGTGTIISNGNATLPSLTINSVSGITTLGSSLTLGTTIVTTLTSGTLALAGYTLTTGIFSSSVANTRSIDFSTGNIELVYSIAGGTSLSMATATGFTYTGTGGFTSNMTVQRGFRFGSTAGGTATNAPNLSLTGGAGEALIITASWFNTLNCTGSTSTISGSTSATATTLNLNNLTLASGGTYTNLTAVMRSTGSISGNGKSISALTIDYTGTCTLASALTVVNTTTFGGTLSPTLNLNGFDLTTASFSSTNAIARTITFGSNYIVITSTLSMDVADNFTWTGTTGFKANANNQSISFGNTSGASASNAINLFVPSGSATVFLAANSWFNKIDCTGSTGNVGTSSVITARPINVNNLILSATAIAGAYSFLQVNFYGTTSTLNGQGKSIYNLSIPSGGTTTLESALGFTAAYTQVANTTLDLAGFTLTAAAGFTYTNGTISNFGTISTTTYTHNGPTFTLNSGAINCSVSFVLSAGSFTLDSLGSLGVTPTFTHDAGTFTLGKNYALTAAGTYTFNAGTINLAGFTLSTGTFSSNSVTTRDINFSTGNIDLTHTTSGTTSLSMQTATGFTYTGTGGFTSNMTVQRGFRFGSSAGGSITNAPNLSLTGGAFEALIATGSWFNTLNCTGSTSTVSGTTSASATTLNLNNLTLASGGTYTNLTATMRSTGSISGNGKSISFLSIDYTGTCTLASALTVVNTTTFGGTLSPTLNLNGFDLTTASFSSSNLIARTVTFGSNYIVITSTLSMDVANNFTWTGTGGFSASANNQSISFGNTSGASASNAINLFVPSGSLTLFLTTNSWFNKIDCTGSTGNVGTSSVTTARTIFTNNLILSATAIAGAYSFLQVNFYGTNSTINGQGKSIYNLSIPSGGTTTLQSALGFTVAYVQVANTTLDLAGYTLTSTSTIEYVAGTLANTGTITCTTWTCTGTFTLTTGAINPSVSFVVTGSFTLGSGASWGAVPTFTHTSGTVTLGKAYALTATGTYTLTAGTINLAGFTLTTGIFSSSGAVARNISFGSGNIDLTHTTSGTQVIQMTTMDGFTWTGTGGFTTNMSTIRQFRVGATSGASASNAFNLTLTGGNNEALIYTGSWFKTLNCTSSGATISGSTSATATTLNLAGLFLNSPVGIYTNLTATLVAAGTISGTSSTPPILIINHTGTTTLAGAFSCSSYTQTAGDVDFATFNFTCTGTIAYTAGTYTNTGTISCTTFNVTGNFTLSNGTLTPSTSFVLSSGSFTYSGGTLSTSLPLFTLTSGAVTLTGRSITTVSFSSSNGNTRSISFDTNNIVVDSLSMATATGFTYTGTGGFTSVATGTTRVFTFGTTGGSATNSPNLTFTGSGTIAQTLTTGSWFNTLNFGTTLFNPGTTSLNLNGLTLASGGTYSTLTPTFVGTGTITTNNNTTLPSLTINSVSGTTSLGSEVSFATNVATTLTSGTLNLNGYNLTTGTFVGGGSSTRSISFGTNNIILATTTAGATNLNFGTVDAFTWTGTGGFTAAADIVRVFNFGTGGGSATNSVNLTFTGSGTAIPVLTTNSWFNTLNFGTTAFTLAVTTQNVNSLTLSSGGVFTNLSVTMRGNGTFNPNGKTIAAFNVNSIGTATLGGNVSCTTYTQTAGTLNLAGYTINASGAISFIDGLIDNYTTITGTSFAVAGLFTMNSGTINVPIFTVTSGTFNYNGGTLTSVTTFTQTSGVVTLGSSLTLASTCTYTFTAGTLSLNGFTLTTGIFSSSNVNVRSISFGVGNIALVHTTAAQTVLAIADATNFNYTGTGGFTVAADTTRTYTFGTSGGSFYNAPNLSITSGASTQTFTDGSFFKLLNFTGTTSTVAVTASVLGIGIDTLTLATGGTYTSLIPVFTRTQTWTSQFSKQLGGIGVNGQFITLTLDGTQSYTATSVCILRAGILNLGGYDLTVGSFSSSGITNRSIIFVNNNIILAHTTPATVVLSVADASNFSYSTVTGGFVSDASITRTYTFGTTGGNSFNAPFLSITSGTAIPTLTTGSWFAKLDFTGADCTPAVTTLNVNSLTLSSGGTFTNLSATMRSNGVITPNGKSIAALSINHTDVGTTTLAGAITCTTQTYLSGSVDFANFNLTSSGAAAYSSGTFSNINIITCTTWTVTGTFVMYQGTITPSTSFVLTSGSIAYYGGTLSPVATFTHTAGTLLLGKSYALTATGTYAFNGGSINLDSYNLTTGIFTSSNAIARSISFGTGNIILATTTAASTVLSMADVTNFTTTATTGGFVSDASVTRTFTFGTTGGTITNAPNLSITSGAAIPTITTNSWFKTLNFTGTTCTPAATSVNVDTLTLATGGTYTNLIPIFTRTQTWTAQFSKQLGGIGFNLAGGTLTLDNTQTYTATSVGSLTAGTLNLGGYDLTIGTFNSSTTNTRSIVFGGNYIILSTTTAAAVNLNIADTTGFTYTGTGIFSVAANITRTFTAGTVSGSASNSPSLLFTGSGTAVQTLTTGGWFNTIDFGSTAFNPGTTALNLNGLSLSPSGVFSSLTPSMRGTGTVTGNGNATLPSLTINSVSGTTTLGSSLTISLVGTTTLSSGTLALAGYTLTTGIFSSTGATARSISFDTGNITLAHTTAATTVLSMADTTNFTCTGTGGFTAAASITRTFTFGTSIGSATNAPNLSITSGAATPTITDNGWFKTLNFTGSTCTPLSTIYVDTLILATGGTYTSFMPVFTRTQTWTAQFSKQLAGIGVNGAGITLTLDNTQTYTATSNCRLSAGTIDLGGADLTIGTITSASTNTRAIAFGTNNIILATTTAAQTNLSFANATNFTYTGTGGFRAAADITRTFTFGTTGGSATNAPNLTFTGSGTAVQTLNSGGYFKTLDFGSTAFNPGSTNLNLASLTLSSGGTFSSLTATMVGTGTITSNSNITLSNLNVNGSGITTSLASNLTLVITGTTTVTLGTLNLNGFNLSTGVFNSNNTNTRSITFGTNNIVLTHTTAATTVLGMDNATNFTLTGTGGFTAAADVTRTYVFGTTGGSVTNSPNLTFTGSGTVVQTITTDSWFKTLDFGTTIFTAPLATINLSNLILSSGGTFTSLTPSMVATGTITPNGKTVSNLVINHTGTTTLTGAFGTTSLNTTTLTQGTFDLAGFSYTTGILSSSNTNTRSLILGSSIITLTSGNGITALSMADATNFTWTGTGGFSSNLTVGRIFSFGSTAGGSASNALNLSLTGTGGSTFTTGSWFKTLDFTGSTFAVPATTINIDTLILSATGTYTSLIPVFTRTQTWTSQFSEQLGGIGFNLIDGTLTLDSTQTYTATSSCVLTNGTIDLGGADLTIGTFSSNNTNTRSIYFGSNNIILSTTTAGATNLDMANASGFTFVGTGGFTTAMSITRTFTVGTTSGSAANAPNLSLTSGSAIPTLTTGSYFKTLDFTGTTFTIGTTTLNIDTLVLATGGTYTSLIPLFTRTQTWTPQFGKQLGGIGVSDSQATLTLENTQTYIAASYLIVNAGTLNLSGIERTFGYFSSTGTGSRSIIGPGVLTMLFDWTVTNGTGFTGSNYTIVMNSSTFAGGGGSYGTLVYNGTTTLTITGSNTFEDIQYQLGYSAIGQVAYTTPGTYSWTAPVSVTSVCVVAVGAGGGGVATTSGGGGGAGGGLGWKNFISVAPGQSYTVVVGAGSSASGTTAATGGTSYFINASTVAGLGGDGATGTAGGAGGTYVGDGGGNGGAGGGGATDGSGGGGAGGYTGNGGAGADAPNPAAAPAGSGSGGGAGGGGTSEGTGTGPGGGVGILGQGNSGAGAIAGSDTGPGGAGSGGSIGSAVTGVGGLYGGGGSGADFSLTAGYSSGGDGAVRIIWGPNREFPSTNTADQFLNIPSSYLVVAGGGGGGIGGGGGAGGLLNSNVSFGTGTTYTVTIGAGGVSTWVAGALLDINGNGANSSITGSGLASIIALGGGAGATSYTANGGGLVGNNGGTYTGADGGSGGGSGGNQTTAGSVVAGGLGTAGRGNNGGACRGAGASPSGGGGGAGAVGNPGTSIGGDGGIGIESSISGTATYYTGGGGGGRYSSGAGGVGGLGGGGAGSSGGTVAGSGTANTGGGGGANGGSASAGVGTSGAGGSGIVVISYSNLYPLATSTTGSPTLTTVNNNIIYTWTTSGSITF